jgi:hypothetical protein
VSRARICLVIATLIACGIFGLAFPVAPHACPAGFEFYFRCGLLAVGILLALPFVTRIGTSILVRSVAGLGLAIVGVVAWVAGMLAANVRFMCGMGYL